MIVKRILSKNDPFLEELFIQTDEVGAIIMSPNLDHEFMALFGKKQKKKGTLIMSYVIYKFSYHFTKSIIAQPKRHSIVDEIQG